MAEDVPSIMNHVSLGSNNLELALAFYDKVLATIGASRLVSHPGATAYGKAFPEFWVQETLDGKPAETANGVHFGFFATSKEQVDEFYSVALEAGATDDGAPGPRADYGEPYYGCFCRDLDGHKIEAVFWDMELEASLNSD
jgi:catechol 2,3-dioxygenase-like lactoylglutathione lyase family enzyme